MGYSVEEVKAKRLAMAIKFPKRWRMRQLALLAIARGDACSLSELGRQSPLALGTWSYWMKQRDEPAASSEKNPSTVCVLEVHSLSDFRGMSLSPGCQMSIDDVRKCEQVCLQAIVKYPGADRCFCDRCKNWIPYEREEELWAKNPIVYRRSRQVKKNIIFRWQVNLGTSKAPDWRNVDPNGSDRVIYPFGFDPDDVGIEPAQEWLALDFDSIPF